MNSALEIFSDSSERINYNLPDFPLYVRKGRLLHFDKYVAPSHWHSDLEFILVLDGRMEYYVNGQTVSIEKGNGIFVNSKRMHYGYSNNMNDCHFIVVVIHPILLGEHTQLGKVYLEEKFGLSTEDYILLNKQVQWQEEALTKLIEIYEEMHQNANPLRLNAQVMSLCANIGDHIQKVPRNHVDDNSWETVWKMTTFIHEHYEEKVTLDDIAFAGNVCRSICCNLFSKYIEQTPNNYLIGYRIQKSCEMLKETNRSISEIAIACGFQSGSYFSYTFRKKMGYGPQDYRKRITIASPRSTY